MTNNETLNTILIAAAIYFLVIKKIVNDNENSEYIDDLINDPVHKWGKGKARSHFSKRRDPFFKGSKPIPVLRWCELVYEQLCYLFHRFGWYHHSVQRILDLMRNRGCPSEYLNYENCL